MSKDRKLDIDGTPRLKEHASITASYPLTLEVNAIQEKILAITRELMEKHYTLNSGVLYSRCFRLLKDHDIEAINSAISDLFSRRILVHGKGVTKETIFNNHNRKNIYQAVINRPGLNEFGILERINASRSSVRWHLKCLEEFNIIRKENIDGSRFYYPFSMSREHDRLHAKFNEKHVEMIFKIVLEHPEITFNELRKRAGVSRAAIMRKVKELITDDFLVAVREENTIVSLKINQEVRDVIEKLVGK